jgi:uncharacterized membrane protein YfcA
VTVLLFVELFVAGGLLGALGGLLGIGGGLFAIPILTLWFGLDQQHAQGTALVMVVPNVAVGLWNYARRGKMDKRLGLALALAAFPLTYLGARVAVDLPSASLRIAFAVFIFAIGILMAVRAFAPAAPAGSVQRKPAAWQFAILVGAFGGLLSGLFGVGGAVFAVPLLAFLFVIPQAAAQGFGLALVAPGTLVGIATYAAAGDVNWAIGIPLAIGGVLTVPYGVKLAYRMPERRLRLIFASLMVVAAIVLVAHSSAGAAPVATRARR